MPTRTPQPRFTLRQRQVLDLLAKRCTNPEIASELGVSLDGAKWHVREIIGILGVASREEAADYWREERGLPRRISRLSRLLMPATLLQVGAAVGAVVAVVALAGLVIVAREDKAEDEVSPAAATTSSPTTLPSPSSTPPPSITFEEYRAKPRPEFFAAGVRIGPSVEPPSLDACDGEAPQPASPASVTGTGMAIEPAWIPAGSDLSSQPPALGPIRCGTAIVSNAASLSVAPDPSDLAALGDGSLPAAEANRGGPIDISRHRLGVPAVQSDVPAEYWREVSIAGRIAAVASVVVDDRYIVEVVVWEQDGVLTRVQARFLPASLVLRVAEGLFPPSP